MAGETWQQAWVEVLPDLRGFTQKANSEITSSLGAAGTAGGTAAVGGMRGVFAGSFLGTVAADLGVRLAAAVGQGVRAGIDYSIRSVDLASALGEQVNAVQVQFGDLADEILALSQKAPKNLNLTRVAFDKLAVRFSSFAKTVAGKGGDASKVVGELTQRGADFASVYDVEVGDALALFQSGLAGQSEPLRAYGIDLSEATVKQFAYANGIAAAGKELTEAEKIQARYGSLLEQTASVQGDLANTAGSYANQQRRFAVALEEAQTSFGEALLPTANELIQFANTDLIPILGDALGEIGPVLTDSLKDALPEIKSLLTSLGEAAPDIISAVTTSAAVDTHDLNLLFDTLNGTAEIQGRDWAGIWADAAGTGFDVTSPEMERLADLIDDALHQTLAHEQAEAAEQAAKVADAYAEGLATADGWQRAADAALEKGRNIVRETREGMSGSFGALGRELGSNFSSGLARGIGDGHVRVAAAARAVAQAAHEAVRKTLDSHSPSRVMYAEGVNAIDGLIGGWESKSLTSVAIPAVASPTLSTGVNVGVAPIAAASAGRAAQFEGNLYLDSGEFLGVVRGQLQQKDAADELTTRMGSAG